MNGIYLSAWSLRRAGGEVAIQWASLSVRGSKTDAARQFHDWIAALHSQ